MTVQGNRGVALVVRAALRSRLQHSDMTNLQRGIAIAPILFVVALLAVLASAIAAGSGAFNGDTSAVKVKAQATAILEYANEVKFAVDRVIAKGCKDTEISFENPIVSGYANPNAPSDKSCHVFDVNGGGIFYKGYSFFGYNGARFNTCSDVNCALAGTGGLDCDLYLRFEGVDSAVCQAANDMLGISGNPYMDGLFASGFFVGTYKDNTTNAIPLITIRGKEAFCAGHNGATNKSIYFVLLAR